MLLHVQERCAAIREKKVSKAGKHDDFSWFLLFFYDVISSIALSGGSRNMDINFFTEFFYTLTTW